MVLVSSQSPYDNQPGHSSNDQSQPNVAYDTVSHPTCISSRDHACNNETGFTHDEAEKEYGKVQGQVMSGINHVDGWWHLLSDASNVQPLYGLDSIRKEPIALELLARKGEPSPRARGFP